MFGTFFRLMICIMGSGLAVYFYIDQANELTQLRLSLPILEKEVKEIYEKNLELEYEITRFENTAHLLKRMELTEFSHLRFPRLEEIILIPESETNNEDATFSSEL